MSSSLTYVNVQYSGLCFILSLQLGLVVLQEKEGVLHRQKLSDYILLSSFYSSLQINIYVYIRTPNTHTHTHTHIYIYIYIYNLDLMEIPRVRILKVNSFGFLTFWIT